MTLNLSQLYQLRTSVKQNHNKVVSKYAFLTLLDSHIEALSGQDELQVIQQSIEPENGLQSVYNHYVPEPFRMPVTREQVKRAYNG